MNNLYCNRDLSTNLNNNNEYLGNLYCYHDKPSDLTQLNTIDSNGWIRTNTADSQDMFVGNNEINYYPPNSNENSVLTFLCCINGLDTYYLKAFGTLG